MRQWIAGAVTRIRGTARVTPQHEDAALLDALDRVNLACLHMAAKHDRKEAASAARGRESQIIAIDRDKAARWRMHAEAAYQAMERIRELTR